MTKSFTAATVLQLRDHEALRLDDPVAGHVPAAAGLRGPTADSPPVSIRHLLTMASGLPTDDPWGDRQQSLPAPAFTELLRGGLSFAWTPGTAFEYSNLGYALLGLVIESCTGLGYRDAVAGRLLDPLGMTSTGFDHTVLAPDRRAAGHRPEGSGWEPVPQDPYGSFAPMGGLFSTVADLARWIAWLSDAFPPRDDPEPAGPLCRASRREMQQAHRGLPAQLCWPSVDAVPTVRATGYGFGLLIEHDPVHGLVVGHSGGYPGFGSHMRWHPGTGLGVIVLGNATYTRAYQPAARMLSALLAGTARSARRSHRANDPGQAAVPASAAQRPGIEPAQPAPSGLIAWEATDLARLAVERLLLQWDDRIATELFADNVELDRPLPQRRAELELLRDRMGRPFGPDPTVAVEHPSPAQCSWWLRGPEGRARLEVMLTPQHPPRVQSLAVHFVPQPAQHLHDIAKRLAAELARPRPKWPTELPTAVELNRTRLGRLLQVGGAWAGACTIIEVTASDGKNHATFRLAGEQGVILQLSMELEATAGSGLARVVRRFALSVES
jgi:CubicO group peptidase (beta-lactamase class C family)